MIIAPNIGDLGTPLIVLYHIELCFTKGDKIKYSTHLKSQHSILKQEDQGQPELHSRSPTSPNENIIPLSQRENNKMEEEGETKRTDNSFKHVKF